MNILSVDKAYQNECLDRDEYMGYLKGTAIDHILNCEERDNPIDELDQAVQFIIKMYYLIGSEKLNISVDEFKEYSELLDALNKRCECNECKNR